MGSGVRIPPDPQLAQKERIYTFPSGENEGIELKPYLTEEEVARRLLNAAEDWGTKEEITFKNKIWEETKKIWIVSGPSILIRVSSFGIGVISQAFIGHIGPTELAAYALIFTVLLRFANGILLGMTSGLGTLCGQAYGAKKYSSLGIYLQQSWIVLIITSTMLLPLFIFATPILKALGQEEQIANTAGTIALWFIPVVYSYVVSFSCHMYLQAQSKNVLVSCVAICSLLLHVVLSWLLTVKYKFGIPGAMISTIVAYWMTNVCQLTYVMFGGCRETWGGFTTLAFRDLGPIIKLSISSGAMICLELWYNSILILLTGHLKNAEVSIDALSICLNISNWAMTISIGFMHASSVRVSNELGRKDSESAKYAIVVIVLKSFCFGFVLFLLSLFFRGKLGYLFTKSTDVAKAVAHLSPLLAFTILLNGVQPVLSGVANGAGWQSSVAYVNIGTYYFIGIPLGVTLGYVLKLQIEGVWVGMIIGTVVQTITLVIMTHRTDWDTQVSLAQKRVNRWSVEAESDELKEINRRSETNDSSSHN